MSQRIVVKSFADLALVLKMENVPEEPAVDVPPTSPDQASSPRPMDLAHWLAELQSAGETLAKAVRDDQTARDAALRDLACYDALVAAQREAETARERAHQTRVEAETLAQTGFTEAARATAAQIAGMASQAEAVAAEQAAQRQVDAERLAASLDLERLLAERRRQQEAEQARAAAAERERRVAETLNAAEVALREGRWREAAALLDDLPHGASDRDEVKAIRRRVAQLQFADKVTRAENALWTVRRDCRHDPAQALAHLTALDVDGLPDTLARQVFGAWVQACSRLCQAQGLLDPLRYAPRPGRGLVIARRHPDAAYTVVSTLGMADEGQVGQPVSERVLRVARPLR